MRRVLHFLLIAFMFVSCRPVRQISTKETEVITMRDTTYVTKRDSASLLALLECDSLGQVQMKEIDRLQGKNIMLDAKVIDNHLFVNSFIPVLNITVQYPERLKTVEVEREVNRLTDLQKAQIGGFWLLFIVIIIIWKKS